jgi:hypothetical protein
VLVAGLRLRVPLWQLLTHDWSRFTPGEFLVCAPKHAGLPSPRYLTVNAHHQRLHPHHWEYWQGREMPERFAREMVADWFGRGRAFHGRWEAAEWYAANRDAVTLHPSTRAFVESLLNQRASK